MHNNRWAMGSMKMRQWQLKERKATRLKVKIEEEKIREKLLEEKVEKLEGEIKELREKLEEVKPGNYWFTDDDGRQWLVEIWNNGKAFMIQVGSKIVREVESIGYGEFIGPLPLYLIEEDCWM